MSAPRSKATKAARRSAEVIDFDAIRKKRGPILKELPKVKIGGKQFTLAPTLPLSVTEEFADGSKVDENGDTRVLLADMQRILAELFGEKQWTEIKRHIDITDLPELFTVVFDKYGESVGESSPSGQS